jgi:glyoxylase-like metal-dependent hydrolase (beta-lactamase superfamily II)
MLHTEVVQQVRAFRVGRTMLGRSYYYTAAYYVDGLMVDTGCYYTVEELVAALQGLHVHTIVNTHSHEDHVGANAAIQAEFGAKVQVHPLALPVLASPRELKLLPYQKVMWGRPAPSLGSAIGDFVETDHHRFRVILTPGHGLDHICLYEPNEGWLFTGDAYVGGKDRALRKGHDIWSIIASLRKLAELDAEWLFSGSGTVKSSAPAELASKIAYLEEIGDKILTLHRKGLSVPRIRRKVLGPELPITYITLGDFNGDNLVRSYISNKSSKPSDS